MPWILLRRRRHSFAEIVRVLGANWSAMSPDEKRQFEEQAGKDKERYRKEKEAYEAAHETD